MTRKVATVAAKAAVVAVIAVLIAGGAVGIYLYTSSSGSTFTSTVKSSTNNSSAQNSVTTSASGNSTQSGSGFSAGSQDASGNPQGAWADYLGYIRYGHSLAPHLPNAAQYPCPSGMNANQCQQFKASC